ncbi:BamA/TamA family outer membrane protein [Alistipes ihumii]|uniref:translocation and assembly module lipoprotein TamL n=1 Tax=Alistipes ihumii TaxID=1470347 RepID=UPI003A8446DE
MKRYRLHIAFLTAAALVAGCSTTKRLGQDEVLYTGVRKITIEADSGVHMPSYVESAVKNPLSVKPNNPLYSPYIRTPLPVGLWAYNYLHTEKTKGFKHWLYERLAKDPVLVSSVQPELRVQMVSDILANYGYFGSRAEYETRYKKHGRKARLSYRVYAAPPWRYSRIAYPAVRGPLTALVDSLQSSSLLKTGAQYNIDTLAAERTRLSRILRNRGYYYFRPEYFEYQADTTRKRREVDLRLLLKPGIPAQATRSYRIGDITVNLQNIRPKSRDSMRVRDMRVYFDTPRKIRPKVLARNVNLRPGELFTVDAQNATQTNLNKFGIFRYVNLSVTPLDSLQGGDRLDVTIDAGFDYPLEAELEVNVSSKSNSFLGPGASFKVSNNNFFHGGEVFTVALNGAYEWQTGNSKRGDEKSSLLNSYEFGLNATLDIKRLLVPQFISRGTRYPAKTSFQIGVDLMNRPKFFQLISFGGSASYDFQTSPRSFHSFTVLKLVYNKLLHTTAEFDRTMDENPAIALSFRDQFIPSMNYTYTYDNTFGPRQNKRIFWQNSITSAGNLLYGAMELFGKRGAKYLFGNQFSQFIKGVSEIRYSFKTGRKSWLVTRLLIGAGYAYGNSKVMPYSEQFYIGGANSIRAFTVRSLGPGSYHPKESDRNSYLDQTGDFKMEANVEFRFPLMGDLHGALFVDAGNIWLLKNDPNRPGGTLKWKGLLNEVALGTGFGLRYDLKFIILRADLGIAIHTPYPNPDKPHYYNISSFKDGLGFHLAIGYPF